MATVTLSFDFTMSSATRQLYVIPDFDVLGHIYIYIYIDIYMKYTDRQSCLLAGLQKIMIKKKMK